MIDVGYSGASIGMTLVQSDKVRDVLRAIENARVHHGDCVGGDRQVHAICRELGRYVVVHPPISPSKRAFCVGDEIREVKPYLDRNQDIVDEVNILIAAPDGPERLRSGTWSTVRRARKRGIPYVVILPDGKVLVTTAS